MAYEVTNTQEIYLGGYKYQARSPIIGSFIDPFANQISVGGDDYGNQLGTSQWVIDNLTGGIGTEKFVSPTMCYWTDCIIEYPGHILPPRLATSIDLSLVSATAKITNYNMETAASGWTGGERSSTQAHGGTYSWQTIMAVGTATQVCTSVNDDTEYTLSAWVYASQAGKARISLSESGGSTVYSSYHTGTPGWEQLTTTILHSGTPAGTITAVLRLESGATIPVYFDDVTPSGGTLALANGTMEASSSWTGGSRSSDQAHGGTYSWKVGYGTAINCYQDITLTLYTTTPSFTFKAWVYASDASAARIGINDGVTPAYSSYHTGTPGWEQLTVTRTLDGSADKLRLEMRRETGGLALAYFDDATLTVNLSSGTVILENYNSELYLARGKFLAKLSSDRTEFALVNTLVASVTALVASLNSRLYIYQGDSTNYYWMATTDVLTQSNSANANWGIQYDAKLFKMNTSGAITYSTDPDGATPTWTSAGSITDIASQIEGFVIGRDASGNSELYVQTNSIFKAYDSATPQWLDTEAVLPNHPNGGKGAAYFNSKIYLSYGLAVKEYYPENGSLLDVGLTERDGLPVEYNGEIVKLQGEAGVKLMFALVDASQTTGNSKSGLYAFNGYAWYCWWKDTTNNQVMYDCIVSSASSGYAVYWGVGSSVYYIDIPRGIQNPDKISQNYGTAGVFLSPWFDAGDQGAAKLAKELNDFAKGITTTETVALSYRIDHATTTIDTVSTIGASWTTLETLNTTGEDGYNEELFASGAGIAFKSIQLRLDFVTAGSTSKADIQELKLRFKKRTGVLKIRRWIVEVLLNDYANGPVGNDTAKAKIANLKSALTSSTDVVFSYRPNAGSAESYYVSVECDKFEELAGPNYNGGYYRLILTEV